MGRGGRSCGKVSCLLCKRNQQNSALIGISHRFCEPCRMTSKLCTNSKIRVLLDGRDRGGHGCGENQTLGDFVGLGQRRMEV